MKRLWIFALLFMTAALGRAQQPAAAELPAWDEAALRAFALLPVQDSGRVKPLSTYARFELIKLSGRASARLENGEKLTPTAWLLDVMVYPELARGWPLILVENPMVMSAVGLPDTKPRTRFSYDQVSAVQEALLFHARRAVQKEDKQRSMFDRQVLRLYSAWADLDGLLHALDFARWSWPMPAEGLLPELARARGLEPLPANLTFSQALTLLPAVLDEFHKGMTAGEQTTAQDKERLTPLADFYESLEQAAQLSTTPALLPPPTGAADATTWLTPGEAMRLASQNDPALIDLLAHLEPLQTLPALRTQPEAFAQALLRFSEQVQPAAAASGQMRHATLEDFLYRSRLFQRALAFFILGFVVIAFSWMAPRSRALKAGGWGLTATAALLLVAGITVRCIIRGRPPITSLYDTTLFVPAVAVVLALAVEFINRRGLALAMASILGSVGLFLANRYELRDGVDTMEQMRAVLDSNFWLATHVTTITIGYSAGLLAGALGHVTILGRLLRLKSGRPDFYANVTAMLYGVVCFGVFFSFIGTVLGGIWANESWGRFWGWDPKENGALLLILWMLIMLHGRLAGWLGEIGLSLTAIAGAMVVAFSWWGVNLLGVGLHSYGFTSGIFGWLMAFWTFETIIIMLGLFVKIRNGNGGLPGPHTPGQDPQGPGPVR